MPHKKAPRIVIKSLGLGVILMAIFTFMWLGVASAALTGNAFWICIIVMLCIGCCFVMYGTYILKKSSDFPFLSNRRAKKKADYIKKWYGITFGLEGALIGLSCLLLYLFNQSEYIMTTIALIVGLHFFPLAKIFDRQLDYYTGIWTILIALFTFFLLQNSLINQMQSFLLLGIGVTIATIAYGIFMIWLAQDLFKKDQR